MNFDIFTITYLIWISSEIVLNRIARSGKNDKKSADKHSELLIWVAILVCIALSSFISARYACVILDGQLIRYIGLAVLYLGIAVRLIAIRQLGRYFTVDVTIREDHQLMQSGLYKYVRHPSYLGACLSLLGLGLTMNNWYGLLAAFLPVFFTFVYRMNIEEKVLTERFGKQYEDYKLTTKRVFPFIY